MLVELAATAFPAAFRRNRSYSFAEPPSGSDQNNVIGDTPSVFATVSVLNGWLPNLWTRPFSSVVPLSAKSPSHVPPLPELMLPELPADEKYNAPDATTSLTA